jgi:hypothetical protein
MLVPEGIPLEVIRSGGRSILRVPEFSCHQMVELKE